MALSKEELDVVIPRILAGDQEAFELFYDEYFGIVRKFAGKWYKTISVVTRNLYDFEDICQEILVWLLKNLHNYDSEKGAMSTWMYAACESACHRIKYYWDRDMRREYDPVDYEDDEEKKPGIRMTSLNKMVGSDQDTEFVEVLSNDSIPFTEMVISQEIVYDYVWVMKLFIEKLSDRQRIIYIHFLMGLTLEASSGFIGITRERVRQIRNKISKKCVFLLRDYNKGKINTKDAARFSTILLSEIPDDIMVEMYHYDLATVKICRQALEVAGLYEMEVS